MLINHPALPQDHTFDHRPSRSTRKQRTQDRQRAFPAERKRLKKANRGREVIKTTFWDVEAGSSILPTPTSGKSPLILRAGSVKDLAFCREGKIFFVNVLFNAIAFVCALHAWRRGYPLYNIVLGGDLFGSCMIPRQAALLYGMILPP